jgi:hypothetical protein
MKTKWIYFLAVTCLMAGCVSIPDIMTSTPTVSMPTATATKTPDPGPVPGSGKLLVVVNNEVKLINADGSGETTIISKQQFETQFAPLPAETGIPYWSGIISPDGKKLLVLTCTRVGYSCENYKLYLSDMDFKRVKTFESYEGGVMQWSDDGSKILVRPTNGIKESMDIISAGADFGEVTQLPVSSSAFLSSDGNQVYYYDEVWSIVNSDSTEAHPLKCDMCSMVSNPSSFVIAESPNRQLAAIGYLDGTVIIASTSNLSNFKLASVGNYVSQIHWSPDGKKMAVDVNTDSTHSDVIILGTDGTVIEKLARPEGVNYVSTCGWSPDSAQIDYMAILSAGNSFYLHTLGQQEPFPLFSTIEGGDQSCPVWLPSNP